MSSSASVCPACGSWYPLEGLHVCNSNGIYPTPTYIPPTSTDNEREVNGIDFFEDWKELYTEKVQRTTLDRVKKIIDTELSTLAENSIGSAILDAIIDNINEEFPE